MKYFVMLVGIPGSGKSTYAKKLTDFYKLTKSNVLYLNSDKIREELYGDENILGNTNDVFSTMQKRMNEYYSQNDDGIVIYDATFLTRKRRVGILNQLPKNILSICHIIWCRPEVCITRDGDRDRHVGKEVIINMMKQFQTPNYDEGWYSIDIIKTSSLISLDDYNLNIPHDNSHHPGTIQEHIDRVKNCILEKYKDYNNIFDKEEFRLLYQIAQLHDLGKFFTKSFVNSKGETTEEAHYYSHQNVSAYLAIGWDFEELEETNPMRDLNITQKVLELSWYVCMHMEPFFQESKYYENIDPERKDIIKKFNEFDRLGA